MMLMTKFGKFKLKFIASINLAALLSIFNIASSTSSYWIKYIDNSSGSTHFAGMWRSCPNQGPCIWKNGIVNHEHSPWSILVRILISLGTISNVFLVGLFTAAFICKLNKKSKFTIRFLEAGNLTLVCSFISLVIGFCIFVSSRCNYGLWLHVFSMISLIVTCNLLIRIFASMYFQNTRFKCSKSVETGISHSKLPCSNDEVVALTEQCLVGEDNCKTVSEMNKNENGSSEALIPTPTDEAKVELNLISDENKTSELIQEGVRDVSA